MSTQGADAGLRTFEGLNAKYEKAFGDNQIKKACITHAISLLSQGSRVLDVGCGTGKPVAAMLASAGFKVVGCDVSPKMIEIATNQVEGQFTLADLLSYDVEGSFAGIFIIFSTLQLSYRDLHSAISKYANALEPGGLLAFGQCPSETYVADDSPEYDETKTYVENFEKIFMGEVIHDTMLHSTGTRRMLSSMGLQVVWEKVDTFHPLGGVSSPEVQQYIIAKRPDEKLLSPPKPLPKPAT